jgi:hypothetical protein
MGAVQANDILCCYTKQKNRAAVSNIKYIWKLKCTIENLHQYVEREDSFDVVQ